MKNSYLRHYPKAIIALLLTALAGCATPSEYNYAGLLNLKRLAQHQIETEKNLKNQKNLFLNLKADIENNLLSTGISKQKIISKYGDPIISLSAKEISGVSELLLYRLSTVYFNTDKIYLFFDDQQLLKNWLLQLAY